MVTTFDTARKRMWRVATIFLVLVFFGVASDVAQAKMPPFEIEVTTDGTMATITVEIDRSYGFDPLDIDGLVAVYPESALDGRLRPIGQSEAVHLSFARVGIGIYQATIDLDQAGRWAVVPFPTIPDYEPPPILYPNAILFETVASSATIWIAAAGAVVAALLIYGFRTRKGRSRTPPTSMSPGGVSTQMRPLSPSTTAPTPTPSRMDGS